MSFARYVLEYNEQVAIGAVSYYWTKSFHGDFVDRQFFPY